MPKIIENIRERLLEEARRQVLEQGYSTMTIRSVAGACGVGVGTVYNYFPSKDMLVASFMLEDWLKCYNAFEKGCKQASEPREALQSIYHEITLFLQKHRALFVDEKAGISFASSFQQRHMQLREQIAKPLLPICQKQTKADPEFLADFLAESLLTWTNAECDFEQIAGILLQLF